MKYLKSREYMLVFCLTRYFYLPGIFYVRAFHLLQAFQSLIILMRFYYLLLRLLMHETRIAIIIRQYKYKTALSKSEFLISSILSFSSLHIYKTDNDQRN